MAPLVSLCVVTVAALGSVCARFTGGWTSRDPNGNPKYKELAHFALASRNSTKLKYYDTVLELKNVETQLVSGMNYRLTFTIAATSCKVNVVPYSDEACPPISNQAKGTCTAVVYEKPWEHFRQVTSLKCT